jgi:flavin-dependent dehydrogenase
VTVAFGASVTDVDRDKHGRVTGIRGHGSSGSSFHVGATVTVGADGLHSVVARATGAPVEREASHASAFIYAHISGMATDAYEWFYEQGVTAGVIPTNDGEACVWVGTPADRFRTELGSDVAAGYRRLLAKASPDLALRVAAAPPPARLRRFAGSPGFMRRPWGPGWALVGDSGYYKDPITAHGMSDALRDAELTADAIMDVFGGTPEHTAMDQYHRTRDALSDRLFTVTDTIASYEWDTKTVEGHLRQLSAAMGAEVEHLLALDAPVVSA